MISILVPFRPDDGIREDNWVYCWRWWNRFLPPNEHFEICVGSCEGEDFNRSKARNEAFEKSSADLLIIADADTIPDQIPLAMAIARVRSGEVPWSVPYKWYYNLSTEYSEHVKASADFTKPDTASSLFSYEHKVISWAGVNIVPREAYEKVGGYDERFVGWGHEDVAFRIKLDHEWGHHHRQEAGNAYHFWHPINKNETFNSDSERRNRALFQREYVRKYGWKDERLARDATTKG